MANITQFEENRQEWVKQVKSGDSTKALELLYRAYRKEFIFWITQQNACTEQMALDIFQESVLALYKNAKKGHLDAMKSSIKTYLFAIGRKIFLKQTQRQKIKWDSLDDNPQIYEKLESTLLPEKHLSDRQLLISKLLPKLRLVCQDILVSFYYKNMSLKAIAEQQGYRSTNVAKVMKSRCMEGFRKLVYQHTKTKH